MTSDFTPTNTRGGNKRNVFTALGRLACTMKLGDVAEHYFTDVSNSVCSQGLRSPLVTEIMTQLGHNKQVEITSK